jgi:hypothetical protein
LEAVGRYLRQRSGAQLRIVQLERELQWAHLKIQVLEEKLRQQRIRMLGPQSETLSNLQLELLADEEPSLDFHVSPLSA